MQAESMVTDESTDRKGEAEVEVQDEIVFQAQFAQDWVDEAKGVNIL